MLAKIFFGVSIASALALSIIAAPLLASALIVSLTGGSIKLNDDELEKVVFNASADIPTDGTGVFGGYGVLTDGTLLVATSHKGVFDSETQGSPDGTFKVCTPGEVAAGLCGPEWHTHFANLQADPTGITCAPNANLGGARLEVASLTFEEPSEKLKVSGSTLTIKDVPTAEEEFTDAVTGSEMDFQLGALAGALVEFNLEGRLDGSGSLHICVEDVAAVLVTPTGGDGDNDNDDDDEDDDNDNDDDDNDNDNDDDE